MTQHTPGPWVYFGNDDSPFWGQIRSTEDFSLIAQQVDGDDRHEDFVLMAAAPDLLRVCQKVVEWTRGQDSRLRLIDLLEISGEITGIIKSIERESAQ